MVERAARGRGGMQGREGKFPRALPRAKGRAATGQNKGSGAAEGGSCRGHPGQKRGGLPRCLQARKPPPSFSIFPLAGPGRALPRHGLAHGPQQQLVAFGDGLALLLAQEAVGLLLRRGEGVKHRVEGRLSSPERMKETVCLGRAVFSQMCFWVQPSGLSRMT